MGAMAQNILAQATAGTSALSGLKTAPTKMHVSPMTKVVKTMAGNTIIHL
jgi:hypothetical protein